MKILKMYYLKKTHYSSFNKFQTSNYNYLF